MKIGRRYFHPPVWSVLISIGAVTVFSGLGFWQLDRAALKQEIKDQYAIRLNSDYLSYPLDVMPVDMVYRKLAFEGSFDAHHHFLLDNRVHRGRAGFHVLTPFHLKDEAAIVLVDRGWAPWGETREPLPQIRPALVEGWVRGIVHLPQKSPFQIGQTVLNDEWPQLIPYLDLEVLQAQYSSRLLPMVLWMAPDIEGEYVREWQPVWMPPEKSRAYAVQWFSFAAITLVLFFILNMRKVE